MNFTRKVVDAIIKLYNSNGLTKKDSNIYGFYVMMWYLRDNGLAKIIKKNYNGENVWSLTDKGKEIGYHLIEIKRILGD